MRIRSEQVQQIQAGRETEFCRRLCVELRAKLPNETSRFGDPALSKRVSDAFEKTKRYQIAEGDAVRAFVKLALLIDPQFDELPDVQRFLALPGLDPDTKIKLLSKLTSQHLRARAS